MEEVLGYLVGFTAGQAAANLSDSQSCNDDDFSAVMASHIEAVRNIRDQKKRRTTEGNAK